LQGLDERRRKSSAGDQPGICVRGACNHWAVRRDAKTALVRSGDEVCQQQ
jgi:hypothetical protein